MDTNHEQPVTPDALPVTVRAFLAAHVARETEAALRLLAPDAVVVDEGQTYRGSEGVREFLERAGSEFTYTTELVAAGRGGPGRWVAVNRLEGDFPGGVAELPYRFSLSDDLIEELVIG
ncbi:MAG: DUF4440 domain-containing protein [Nocardioides sp.]|nr:DUF4440 domain-containing protein [Nocardioides sp.]